jgi:hypothetical protein
MMNDFHQNVKRLPRTVFVYRSFSSLLQHFALVSRVKDRLQLTAWELVSFCLVQERIHISRYFVSSGRARAGLNLCPVVKNKETFPKCPLCSCKRLTGLDLCLKRIKMYYWTHKLVVAEASMTQISHIIVYMRSKVSRW